MPRDEFYMRKIRRLTESSDLLALLDRIEARTTRGWPAGKAFEYLVLRAFEIEAATVRYPFPVTYNTNVVEQVDGVVYAGALACMVESKDHSGPINVEPIAKLRNQLMRRPAAMLGMVFSRAGFTQPAVTLSQFLSPQTILLWEGSELRLAIERRMMVEGVQLKYRNAMEHGLPQFNLLAAMPENAP